MESTSALAGIRSHRTDRNYSQGRHHPRRVVFAGVASECGIWISAAVTKGEIVEDGGVAFVAVGLAPRLHLDSPLIR